jgi:hypothetical protein
MSGLKDILAISGYGGLYKFISQGRNGIIVESLVDNKRTNMPATSKISSLDDIAIYTGEGEKALLEVLTEIKNKYEGKTVLSSKPSNNELKELFEEVVPDYDKDKVYVSDIKKVVKWYNLLVELDMLSILDEKVEDEPEDSKTEKNTEETDKKED